MPDKVSRHKALCEELNSLYARKNHDYGDSFHLSFEEEGLAMARIRLGDKFNRFKALSCGADQKVADESIRDTLIDLANYALMTVLEMEPEKSIPKTPRPNCDTCKYYPLPSSEYPCAECNFDKHLYEKRG